MLPTSPFWPFQIFFFFFPHLFPFSCFLSTNQKKTQQKWGWGIKGYDMKLKGLMGFCTFLWYFCCMGKSVQVFANNGCSLMQSDQKSFWQAMKERTPATHSKAHTTHSNTKYRRTKVVNIVFIFKVVRECIKGLQELKQLGKQSNFGILKESRSVIG